jgi:hypothetical protein
MGIFDFISDLFSGWFSQEDDDDDGGLETGDLETGEVASDRLYDETGLDFDEISENSFIGEGEPHGEARQAQGLDYETALAYCQDAPEGVLQMFYDEDGWDVYCTYDD